MMTNRRAFLKKTGAAIGSLPFIPSLIHGNSLRNPDTSHPVCYFSKHLEWLEFDDLGIVLREAGFNGADLTVRDGGHVEPSEAKTTFGKAARALDRQGISVPMVVTRITGPRDKGLDDLLKVLSDHGVRYYRMGYLNYDYDISMEKNISRFHDVLRALADKNAKHDICSVYQNHAGNRLGASIWDLLMALRGIDPDYLGCQFDVRHATFEGGRSWENDFRAIKGHVRTTVVKDFHWTKNDKGQWTYNNTPMGKGMVDFEKYFKLYHEMKIRGPISNHSEYPLITKDESKLPKAEKMKIAIARLKRDVDYIRAYLK
ncbi:MAG: sugar phosphate isomerase/epimerase [Cytophagales bacterium]|nr:sugar phosphate isomerase/epimerase [Cytophagales bacterium]